MQRNYPYQVITVTTDLLSYTCTILCMPSCRSSELTHSSFAGVVPRLSTPASSGHPSSTPIQQDLEALAVSHVFGSRHDRLDMMLGVDVAPKLLRNPIHSVRTLAEQLLSSLINLTELASPVIEQYHKSFNVLFAPLVKFWYTPG